MTQEYITYTLSCKNSIDIKIGRVIFLTKITYSHIVSSLSNCFKFAVSVVPLRYLRTLPYATDHNINQEMRWNATHLIQTKTISWQTKHIFRRATYIQIKPFCIAR